MERDGEEESGEIFSSNESREYMLCENTAKFTVQGLRNALTAVESMVTEPPCPQMSTSYN